MTKHYLPFCVWFISPSRLELLKSCNDVLEYLQCHGLVVHDEVRLENFLPE